MRSRLAACCLGLALGACSSAPKEAPPTPAAPTAPVEPTPDPNVRAAPPPRPVTDVRVVRRTDGSSAVALQPTSQAVSSVHLSIGAGADAGSPGLAELAAEVLVAGSDASSGRRSLRTHAADLGGSVEIDVGPTSTWVTLRLPPRAWREGLGALLDAVRAPIESRSQIERIRDELIERRAREIWADPGRGAARAALFGDAGTGAHVAGLLDRDPSEVRLFHGTFYRPQQALLAVEAPAPLDEVRVELQNALDAARWPAPGASPQVPRTPRRQPQGILWAPAAPAGQCRPSIVIGVPPLGDASAAADAHVLLACVTLDGVGGRLEQAQRERGLGHVRWTARWSPAGEAAALVLSTTCTPTEAGELWRAFEAARQSLRRAAPTASELALALRRATLTTRLRPAGIGARLHARARAAIGGDGGDGVERRLLELAGAGAGELAARVDAFLALPTTLIVFGGEPPADLAPVQTFDLMPAAALAKLVGAPPAAESAAGVPWLLPSLDAVGGAEALRNTVGCRTEAQVRLAGAAAMRETAHWTFDGTLSRTRELLDQSLATEITARSATERSGQETRSLDADEVDRIRREWRRHPLSLLAAHAHGRLDFRPVAQRREDDREVLVLEAVGGGFQRLRIHVDATSRLIRLVETWETLGDGTQIHVQDRWSDYRSSGGLRLPFRRITELDDGRNRTETVYSSVVPSFRGS